MNKKMLIVITLLLGSLIIFSCSEAPTSQTPSGDHTAPTISQVTPLNNATGIAVNTNIIVTFSENMKASSFSTSSLSLSYSGGSVAINNVVVSANSAVFTISSELQYNIAYTATLANSVQDSAGNSLANNYTWSFTTTIIDAPSGLTGTSDTFQVALTWESVTGATGYNLYWSTSAGLTTANGTKISSATSPYTHTGLTNGKTYYYLITANKGQDEGGPSGIISVTPNYKGILDTTFNSMGYITKSDPMGYDGHVFITDITIDSKGKILVCGYTQLDADDTVAIIWKFNSNGTLDTSFGAGKGYTTRNVAQVGYQKTDQLFGIAVDSNDDIYATGCTQLSLTELAMITYKFNESGTIDTSFGGSNAYVKDQGTAGGGNYDIGKDVKIDNNGKIVIVGYSGSNMDTVVWRYNTDGSRDTSFTDGSHTGYVVYSDPTGDNGPDRAHALTIESSGRIIVGGESRNSSGDQDMAVWIINNDGSLDDSCDNDGFFRHNGTSGVSDGDACANDIILDNNGKILITGKSWAGFTNCQDLAVWRLNSDCSFDTTFNGEGFNNHHGASPGNENENGYGIAITPMGEIFVAGLGFGDPGSMIIWKYKSDGTLDTNFNNSGYKSFYGTAGGNEDYGQAIILDENQKILVIGQSISGPSPDPYHLAIWRLK